MQKTKATSQNPSQTQSIVDFIHLRHAQKKELMATRNPKVSISLDENDFNIAKQSFDNIINKIDEALSEGNTIYHLTSDDEVFQNFEKYIDFWQQNQYLSIIDNHTQADTVNTPIVAIKLQPEYQGWGLWFHRQWAAERKLAMQILAIAHTDVGRIDFSQMNQTQSDNTQTANDTNKKANELQQQAIAQACSSAFTIITGGPGTGKTFTVAKLVTLLHHFYAQQQKNNPNQAPFSIALTAPTGKAAQRMQESLSKSLDGEKISIDNAKTLHRLLGIGQDGIPRYHANNPLPDDLVIVDEASMLGLELASQLVDAIKPTGRLVLLGDAHQLAAVDAGSVLADLCQLPALNNYRTELKESKRFDKNSKVGQIALSIQQAISQNTPANIDDKMLNISPEDFLNSTLEQSEKIYHLLPDSDDIYQVLAKYYQSFFEMMSAFLKNPIDIYQAENRKKLFETFDSYRILTAGHHGKLGTTLLNSKIAEIYQQKTNINTKTDDFYHGLPIMITSNNYHLNLFNGDIGICLLVNGTRVVCFADRVIPVSRLSLSICERAYAMTIHKSQGSEFGCVAVCMDTSHGRLLSQELIYTAITRSSKELFIVGEKTVLDTALSHKTLRNTGLSLQFL